MTKTVFIKTKLEKADLIVIVIVESTSINEKQNQKLSEYLKKD